LRVYPRLRGAATDQRPPDSRENREISPFVGKRIV
jgi:hypothetical protein